MDEKEKKCVDPVTTSIVGSFVFSSILNSLVGWIGLEYVKKSFSWFYRRIFGKSTDN